MAELQDRKNALSQQLDRARKEVQVHVQGARAHINVGAKIRAGFRNHRLAWIGGAALLGLVLAKIPARTKKVVHKHDGAKKEQEKLKAGIAVGAAKLIFDLSKPLLMAWATKRVGEMAEHAQNRAQAHPQNRAQNQAQTRAQAHAQARR